MRSAQPRHTAQFVWRQSAGARTGSRRREDSIERIDVQVDVNVFDALREVFERFGQKTFNAVRANLAHCHDGNPGVIRDMRIRLRVSERLNADLRYVLAWQ